MPKCEECNSLKGVKQPCGEFMCDMCCDICDSMNICELLDREEDEGYE